jgi:hypothetical protein
MIMPATTPIKRYRLVAYSHKPEALVDDDGDYVKYEAHQQVVSRYQQEAEAFSAVVREWGLQLEGQNAKIKALENIIAHRDREIAHLEHYIRSLAITLTRGPGALPCL